MGRRSMSVLAVVLLGLAGCRGAGEFTDTLVPWWWRANPFGPEGNAARAEGVLPAIPSNPDMWAWDRFADEHLKHGDVFFRQADARLFFGTFPFSAIAADMSASRFTHTGIFAWEDGEPIIYDTSMCGARRMRLGVWMLDNVGHIGIKRLRAGCEGYAAPAVEYCRAAYWRQVPFDMKLGLGDDHLYCAEMTARAFESAGLPLAPPRPIRDLPRYRNHLGLFKLAQLTTAFEPEQPMYFPGDEGRGLWGSPYLETVYEATSGERPDPRGLTPRLDRP